MEELHDTEDKRLGNQHLESQQQEVPVSGEGGDAGLAAAQLKSVLESRKRHGPSALVHVIINPAAGKDQPILKTLNAVMQTAGLDWEVMITKDIGDGRKLAQAAAEAGADIVAVHGGDGTVMEVASGLIGTGIPIAILPGGTANVMAAELGVPNDLTEACALIANPEASLRYVDMGQVGDHYFALRCSMGFEAAMVEGADRDLKDRVGVLAYGLSALQALADPTIARYQLWLDGLELEMEGLTCIIANSGTMGAPGILLAPNIAIHDGLLDVVVVRKADLPSLVSLAASVVGGTENQGNMAHWQVKEVRVTSDPPQSVQADGEIIGQTPIEAKVLPQAMRVIVPPQVVVEEE